MAKTKKNDKPRQLTSKGLERESEEVEKEEIEGKEQFEKENP